MTLDSEFLQRSWQCVIRERREVGGKSLIAFGEVYLQKSFQLPPSRMHLELAAALEDMVTARGARAAWAAPRGHAKSTLVTLAYVLWCICYGKESYIIIWSSSEQRANELLQHVKEQLETNEDLRTDFPELNPLLHGRQVKPYRQNLITVGMASPVRVASYGVQKAARGTRSGANRPGLIILDDIESEEGCESPDQRDKLKRWFKKTILNMGDKRTNVILLGTIIHYDSLLADYTTGRSPGWDARTFRAVEKWSDHEDLWKKWQAVYSGYDTWNRGRGKDAAAAYFKRHRKKMLAGTKVLWEEKEDYRDLMELRLTGDEDSFSSEKQNEPVDSKRSVFKPENFVYWTSKHKSAEALIDAASPRSMIFGGCDPALGKTGRRHDDTSIVTILVDPIAERCYVLEVDMRRLAPLETVEAIIEKHKRWNYHGFGVETNHYQEMLASSLRIKSAQAGVDVRVFEVRNLDAKFDRIKKLDSLVREGFLEFDRHHRKFLEQFFQFPSAAHDDGPDALVIAMRGGMLYRAQMESNAHNATGHVVKPLRQWLDRR